MDNATHQSELAKLIQQIERENEAAQQGLAGLAHVASHERINARMQMGAEYVLSLIRTGKMEEAEAFLYSDEWCAEET